MMNKTVFNYLAKKMIKNVDAREAVGLYLFGGLSAYQAEMDIFGTATVTVKKIADRLRGYYSECLFVSTISDRPKMHKVTKTVSISYLEDLEVYVFVHDGDVTALQSVESEKDLTELLDISEIYDEVEGQLVRILKNGYDCFKFDY